MKVGGARCLYSTLPRDLDIWGLRTLSDGSASDLITENRVKALCEGKTDISFEERKNHGKLHQDKVGAVEALCVKGFVCLFVCLFVL